MSRLNRCGHTSTSEYEGYLYRIDGRTVVRCNDGVIRLYENGEVLDGLTEKVSAAEAEDVAEEARRLVRARELSKEDPILEEVMRFHLRFSDGRETEPMVLGEHLLWPVGRNAGGDFYAGVTDGQRVVFYGSDSSYDEETYLPLLESVRRVAVWGYLGHH